MTLVATAVAAPNDHDHAWELRQVDEDIGLTVRELSCAGCGEVTFR